MTVGSVSRTIVHTVPSDLFLDFILAACDVEGNFLVIKAFQYTNLLSCMLLDSWVSFFWLELPLLTLTVEQMGDSIVPVLLMVVHAGQVHLGSTSCMRSSLNLATQFPADADHFSHVRVS